MLNMKRALWPVRLTALHTELDRGDIELIGADMLCRFMTANINIALELKSSVIHIS